MARSVNKVILLGNLTRDPELKYTPQGHAVCTFGVATNREWVSNGEKQEAADFANYGDFDGCLESLVRNLDGFLRAKWATYGPTSNP